MFKPFFWSKKYLLWAYGLGTSLVTLLCAQIILALRLNSWRANLYNIFEERYQHTVADFWASMTELSWLIALLIAVAALINYCARYFGLYWRTALTENYIPRWRLVSDEVEGSSQRIQEDCKLFTEMIEGMGLQLVSAFFSLAGFIPLLLSLSNGLALPFVGAFPGSLLWLAIGTSIAAMAISKVVGKKLPGLENENQKAEAAFRKELVLGEDDKERFASAPKLLELFAGVRINFKKLYWHYGYFDIWVNAYNHSMYFLPFICAGPNVITGAITLGTLTSVIDAFGRVISCFSLPITNYTTITKLLSVRKRLLEFERNLVRHERKCEEAERLFIELEAVYRL